MNCENYPCKGDNRIQNCQCYLIEDNQVCAYEDMQTGFVKKCDPGCCNSGKGCPGECAGALENTPPYKKAVMNKATPISILYIALILILINLVISNI